MAKKQKKTKPSTQTWLNDTLQVALDAMVKQNLLPSEDACLMVTTDMGLIVGTHHKGQVDASIFIPLERVPYVTHAFQRVIQALDYPDEIKAQFPEGRPTFPGESIVQGRTDASGDFVEDKPDEDNPILVPA